MDQVLIVLSQLLQELCGLLDWWQLSLWVRVLLNRGSDHGLIVELVSSNVYVL